MAHAIDNVVAFNPDRTSRKRVVSAESTGVINGCRDIAVTRICAALADAFDKIEDELFDLAGKSPDRDAQNMYLDARNQAREKRQDIESAFRSEFVSFFAKKVKSAGDEVTPKLTNRYNLDQLSLVEDDTLTESIAVNDIAKRLTDTCDEELRALSQRMGFLLSEPELSDAANPIAPDTVIKALKSACDQMTSGFQVKLTVLRMVEQHMAQEMLSVYHDINTHLVAKQILPTIRPTFRKAQTHIVRKSATGGADQAAANSLPRDAGIQGNDAFGDAAVGGPATGAAKFPGGYLPAGPMPGNTAAEIFQTLQYLIAGNTSFASNKAASLNADLMASASSGGAGPFPAAEGLTALTPFSQAATAGIGNAATGGATSGVAGTTADEATVKALIAALSHIQQQEKTVVRASPATNDILDTPSGQSILTNLNVLREIKAQGVAAGSNQVDIMTIDIVAMLFDYVFDDKSIPDTIKALIARLQIPVLKVAIIDKGFFSRKSHPVRRLLDTLADASIAFAGEASRDDPLYKKIEIIVDRIHGEFDTDIALFDKMIDELEAFLRERETANAEMVEKSARAMHEREKREMARLVAQMETDRRTNMADLPVPVVAMLKGPWARVLERLYLRDGGRNARFIEAVETAEQLVWSVEPKVDAGQRRDLVAALPLLLRRLQDGLDIAAVETADRARFFAALVDCHAAAVKAGLRGESVATLFASANGNESVAPLFEKLIAEEHARKTAAASINRSGVARIQFTEHGIEIEELSTATAGAGAAIATVSRQKSADDAGESTAAANHFEFTSGDGAADPGSAARRELRRGTWVEFLHEGGKKIRAKLSWVSPLKGVYLFTNPGATEALSIAPDALHRQFGKGTARVLEESSMIDRAVGRMVNSLSGTSA